MSSSGQSAYFMLAVAVALHYYVAVKASPGTPPANYTVPANQWKRWCDKCSNYKPPRAHHCKQCGQCVLRMDHHCPWTNNCVGHKNTPHFFRFLVWVLVGTGYTIYRLGLRAGDFYRDRHLPAYLIRKAELSAVVILILVSCGVWFSVLMLFVRCLLHVASGKTQIEVWDMDRIESQFHTPRLWLQIRKNYQMLHGTELPRLSSWNPLARLYREEADAQMDAEVDHDEIEMNARVHSDDDSENDEDSDNEENVVPQNFNPDDVIFPYDVGFWRNMYVALGPPWTFILPWGRAPGNGYEFESNDDDDQLNLPWPPDGGHNDFLHEERDVETLRRSHNYTAIRQQLDPRTKVERTLWMNDLGETLNDYGVDTSGEDEATLVVPNE